MLKALGVCGGAGVILHPMKKRLIGNIEERSIFHTPDEVQWKLNFQCTFDYGPVNYGKNKVDVIVGAPDCGHSSMFAYSRAKKLGDPTENSSLKLYISSVIHYKPVVFMMENLPKMIDVMGDYMYDVFSDYDLITLIQPVSAWGNSQVTRIRLVLVGIRKDASNKVKHFVRLPDEADFTLKKEGELLKGLIFHEDASLCHVREPDDWMVNMIYKDRKKISHKEAREFWMGEYEDLKKWPANYGNMINQPGVYRNFEHDYPLTARKSNRQFNHAGYMMSPRELARIQGVPDTFKLWYDDKSPMYCVNKARAAVTKTPPYEIAQWFADILDQMDTKL